ncbi:MAG: putative acyltransferase [Candidatus Acidoferrum typicum]|nr:putative acyltransferase [Candidatus Acidoferrum typicum]
MVSGVTPRASVSLSPCSSTDASQAVPKAEVARVRIPVLDGLRGIAILFVMVYHFWLYGVALGPTLWERVYSHAAGVGWVGVDLFFVLSGFLITGILYDSRSDPHYYRVFYARRTVRIFPLYYAFLTLFCGIVPMALGLLHHPELVPIHDSTTAKLFAWSYTVNWYEGFKGFSVVSASLRHFWSLSVEEQFYLAWPFLVLTLTRRRLMALCGFLMVLAFLVRIICLRLHLPDAAYTWTLCRMDSLAIGAIVALAARNPRDWQVVVNWAGRLTLPALSLIVPLMALQDLGTQFVSEQFVLSSLNYSLFGIFFGGCLVTAMCACEKSLTQRFVSWPFLRFFGKYSYCLYICHLPLIVIAAKVGLHSDRLTKVLGNKFVAIITVNGVAFLIAIAFALASWHLFEKHWLRLKDLPFLQRT